MCARALDCIDKNLHHLFLPQIEALEMQPVQHRCGIVSQLDSKRGCGSAWMAGIGSDCLVTVLDLSVSDAVDLTSTTPGYLCLGSMSRSSLDTMPVPPESADPTGVIMYRQEAGTHPYRLQPRTPYASRSLCFTPRFLEQLALEQGTKADAFLESLAASSATLSSPGIELMLSRLDEHDADSAATAFRLTALMTEALACLVESAESEIDARKARGSHTAARLVKDARGLMVANLQKPLTLERIARELCVSRAHLAATYKEETGCGLVEDLRRFRMERAAQMIAEADEALATIARAVGYPRQSSFTVAFKRAYGCSPSEWRDRNR